MTSYTQSPKVRKLPMRAMCERYGVSDRTIDRWLEMGHLPKPMRVNRYRYWDLAELEQFEREKTDVAQPPSTNSAAQPSSKGATA
jgi:predicted DNA-binding transcriptional regulator AlpA